MAGSDVRWTNEALTRCGRAPSLGAMTTLIDTAVTAQVEQLAQRAREASRTLALLSRAEKDAALHALADAVVAGMDQVVEANALDLQRGRDTGMPDGLLDRLRLDEPRLRAIADALRQIATLPDPVAGPTIPIVSRPSSPIGATRRRASRRCSCCRAIRRRWRASSDSRTRPARRWYRRAAIRGWSAGRCRTAPATRS